MNQSSNNPADESLDHNPYLVPRVSASNGPAKGTIDRPGTIGNIVWQTRSAPPAVYENALGDALERVFDAGAVELAEISAGLNDNGFRHADGGAWTPERLAAEFARLGGT
jgi:hypothetical protein